MHKFKNEKGSQEIHKDTQNTNIYIYNTDTYSIYIYIYKTQTNKQWDGE